jgi:hypothetical protein
MLCLSAGKQHFQYALPEDKFFWDQLLTCKCWINLSCIPFLSVLEKPVNGEIGPYFVLQVLSPFLCSGFTVGIL